MLDYFVIEELRKRQEERCREADRPRLELPLAPERHPLEEPRAEQSDENRGVVVIDL